MQDYITAADNKDYPYVVNYFRPFHENEHYYFKTKREACCFAEDLVNTSLMADWKEVEASQYTTPKELYKHHDEPAICVEELCAWDKEDGEFIPGYAIDIVSYDLSDIFMEKFYEIYGSESGKLSDDVFADEDDAIQAAKDLLQEYANDGSEETVSVETCKSVVSQNFYLDYEYEEIPVFEQQSIKTFYNVVADFIYDNGNFAGDGSDTQSTTDRQEAEDTYRNKIAFNEPWCTIAEEDCSKPGVTGAALRLFECKFTVDPETGELEDCIEEKTLKERIIWFKDVFPPLKRDIWDFPKTLDKNWIGYQYGQDYISFHWQQELKNSIDAVQLWQEHGSGLYSVRWCGSESPYVAAQEALDALVPKYCEEIEDLMALAGDWAAFAFKFNSEYWSEHIHDYYVECPLEFVE